MKVLHLTTHLGTGGIPIYVESLARTQKAEGLEVEVASSGGWLVERLQQAQVGHHTLACKTSSELNPKLWFKALPQLLRLVKQTQPDILHAHTRVTQVLASVVAAWTRTPYVSTCHGLYNFRWHRRWFKCWGKKVMVISEPAKTRLVEEYRFASEAHAEVIVNGVDVDRFKMPVSEAVLLQYKEERGLRGAPIIGGVARLSPVKGFDCLLQTVPELLKSFPDLQVLVVGEGPAREALIKQAYQLGVQQHVIIAPAVQEPRIPLAAMDLVVAPALDEGFGLSIVEAMSAKKAVVAFEVGGPAKIIQTGVNGWLSPLKDISALTATIAQALQDDHKRAQIAETAQQQAQAQYGLQRVAEQIQGVYEEAIAT